MKIGVIGAGAVGSACLLSSILRGVAREIVVVNRERNRAKAVVTDLQYGAALVMITAGLNEKSGGATNRNDPAGRLKLLESNVAIYRANPSRDQWVISLNSRRKNLERSCGTLGLSDFMKYIGAGISLGLCFGAALGAAMQNVAVGVAIGVALGVAFGMVFSASSVALARKNVTSDKPPPHPLGL